MKRDPFEYRKRIRERESNEEAEKVSNEEAEVKPQTHVHEFVASTKLAEENDDRHNHRFAGVTSEVIPKGRHSHVHRIVVNTDFLDHHHEVIIETGPPIPVGNGKHVHFVKGMTTINDDHEHDLEFATLIDRPLV
ncbi:YmaF family protein [Gottfriedia sp. NPDC056225]|uniref:YmaF family protein n=1 Tax=Gottfriedia sp. NPDC056225 TaxID=3345751 RepID=UPI001558D9AA|nr:hypothetical protein HPK19_16105 [Arthrobacter citreus]